MNKIHGVIISKFSRVMGRLNKSWSWIYIILEGGKRATKTYSIGQKLIDDASKNRNRKILVVRKTLPALKRTVLVTLLEILTDWEYIGNENIFEHRKVAQTLYFKETGSVIVYLSLDEPDKFHGSEWNIIWMNETREFDYQDFSTLDLTISAPIIDINEDENPNKLIFDYNPVNDIPQWLIDLEFDKRSAPIIRCTYKDNKFLPKAYRAQMDALKEKDDYLWRTLGLGERGELKGKIYEKVKSIPANEWPQVFDDFAFGVDWGFFPDPNVLVFVGKIGKDIYIDQLVYETKMLVNIFAETTKSMLNSYEGQYFSVYADPSQNGNIALFKSIGLNMVEHVDNSIVVGIGAVQSFENIYILDSATDAIREMSQYKNKQDRSGNVIPVPVGVDDHIPDAVRYTVFNRWGFVVDSAQSMMLNYESVGSRRGR